MTQAVRSVSALLAATLLTGPALGIGATPAQSAGVRGDVHETKTGCTSAKPYAKFEKVYAEQGRPEAYKVLVRTTRCQILEQPTQVRLEEAVRDFDFGWGRGTIWRVSPVSGIAEVPDTLYIRIRDGE